MIGWARKSGGRVRHAFQADPTHKWVQALCGKWMRRASLADDPTIEALPRCRACVQAIDRLDKLIRGKRQY